MTAARKKRIVVDAVGICIPGISHSQSGRVWAPNIPGWTDYPLLEEVEASVRGAAIPVAIDSDRACCILGEAWLGAARGCDNAIFLAVGTGIGAGILAHGEILRGAHDIAGAIGWMALDRPFRREYVACGCFEHHASGEGLAKIAREMLRANKRYSGKWKNERTLTAHEVFAAYERGDALARAVIAQAVEFWGMAVANLVSLFNPEKIVFGGGVFGPARRFLGAIRVEAKRWAQPVSMRRVKLAPSRLGGDAGLIGAGRLALRTLERTS